MLCIKSNPPARWTSDVCLDRDTENAECLLIKRWYGLSVGLTRSLSIYISPSLPRPQLLKLPWQLLLPLFLFSTLCLLLPGWHQFHRCVPLLSIQQRLWCSWLVHPILHIVTNSLRMRSEIRAHYIGFGTKVPLLFNQVILHDQFRFTHVFFFHLVINLQVCLNLPWWQSCSDLPRMRLYLQPIRISPDLCPTSSLRLPLALSYSQSLIMALICIVHMVQKSQTKSVRNESEDQYAMQAHPTCQGRWCLIPWQGWAGMSGGSGRKLDPKGQILVVLLVMVGDRERALLGSCLGHISSFVLSLSHEQPCGLRCLHRHWQMLQE